MADNITTAFVTQFQANVALLAQQIGSRLRGSVLEGSHTGESADFLEQFGVADTPVTDLPRNSDTPIMSVPQDRRWVYPQDIDWATLIDSQDRLRMVIDPSSPIAQTAAATMNRKLDDVIATAMLGVARTGKTAQNQISLPGGNAVANTVGASAATGMNVAKLREVRRLLRKAEIDFDTSTVYVGLCSDKEADLVNEIQVINKDYNSVTSGSVLERGVLPGFMGFNFIHTERFAGGAGSAAPGTPYTVPVWEKSGMHLGIWSDLTAMVDPRSDKRYATQLYTKMTIGASRTEESRVYTIACV